MTMHEGHRGRMRERFRKEGLDGFAPHEVIELLLFYGRARGDVNPLAHTLLDTFGSLKGVLEAGPEQLMTVKGVGEETATLLSLMLPMFRRYAACLCEEKKYISCRREAAEYCKALLAGLRTEHFYVISISADNRLLGHRLVAKGTLNETPAYPRIIMEAVLNHNAHSVVLCHNHPSGICKPSDADIATTRHIMYLLSGINVMLSDHIIVAGDQTYSMHDNNLWDDFSKENTLVPSDGKSHLMPRSKKKPKQAEGCRNESQT